MKNKAVLKRFGSYCGWTAAFLMCIYMIMFAANNIFGDPTYGIIIVFSLFGLFALWHMAETAVASEERERYWQEEREQTRKQRDSRLATKKMLTE